MKTPKQLAQFVLNLRSAWADIFYHQTTEQTSTSSVLFCSLFVSEWNEMCTSEQLILNDHVLILNLEYFHEGAIRNTLQLRFIIVKRLWLLSETSWRFRAEMKGDINFVEVLGRFFRVDGDKRGKSSWTNIVEKVFRFYWNRNGMSKTLKFLKNSLQASSNISCLLEKNLKIALKCYLSWENFYWLSNRKFWFWLDWCNHWWWFHNMFVSNFRRQFRK